MPVHKFKKKTNKNQKLESGKNNALQLELLQLLIFNFILICSYCCHLKSKFVSFVYISLWTQFVKLQTSSHTLEQIWKNTGKSSMLY